MTDRGKAWPGGARLGLARQGKAGVANNGRGREGLSPRGAVGVRSAGLDGITARERREEWMPRAEDSTSVGPWFRCWCDILLDPKLRALSRADRWTYLEMQALAKLSVDHTRSDEEVGMLLAGEGLPMTESQVARALDLRPGQFRAYLARVRTQIPRAIDVRSYTGPARDRCVIMLVNYRKRQYDSRSDMPHAKRVRQRLAYSDGKTDSSEGLSETPQAAENPTPIRSSPAGARAPEQPQQKSTTSVPKGTADPAVKGRKLTEDENALKDALFEHWTACTREYFEKPEGTCPRFARGRAANLFANLARDGNTEEECRIAIDIFFRRRFRFREREREKADQRGVDPPAVAVNIGHFENQSQDLLAQARQILKKRRE